MKVLGALKSRAVPDPSLVLYRDRPQVPLNGVGRLPAAMTINSITEYPAWRYTAGGGLVDAADWRPWGYGENLDITGAGAAPTLLSGSPVLGSLDDSVSFPGTAGAQHYQAPTTVSYANKDRVLALLFKMSAGSVVIASTKATGVSAGWSAYATGGFLRYQIHDGVATQIFVTSAALTTDVWYYAELYLDISATGRWFIDGAASGAAVDFSANAGVVDSGPLTIGATTDGAVPYNKNIAFVAGWSAASGWLDTDNQVTLAEQRASLFWGWRPQQARGTAVPTTRTRASNAYIDKVDVGGRKIYLIGQNVPRAVSRLDSNGAVLKGLLSEVQITNLCLRSEEIDNNPPWAPTRCSITNTSTTSLPNGLTSSNDVIHEDGTAASTHFITQSITYASGQYVWSCWFKEINRYQLTANFKGGAGGWSAIFDLSAVTSDIATSGTSLTAAGIIPYVNGWYRCWVLFTPGSGANNLTYFIRDGASGVFNGLNQDSLYCWGSQVEAGVDYPTSYMPTAASAVIREEDVLLYKGDDGNLGGVGSNKRGSFKAKLLIENYDLTLVPYIMDISDGASSADRIRIDIVGGSGDSARAVSAATGESGGAVVPAVDVADGAIHDIDLEYKFNDLSLTVDSTTATDTDCGMPDDIDRIQIAMSLSQLSQLNGVLADIEFYPHENRS